MNFNPVVFSLHIVLFIVVLVALKYLYFDPILAILKRRDDLTKGKEESAEALLSEIEKLKNEYKSQVNALKRELEERRQETLKTLAAETSKTISDTKHKTDENFNAYSKKLDEQVESLRQSLPDLGNRLGDEIVEVVSGARVVSF